MELLQFGFGPQNTNQVGGNARPVSLIRANNIKILWASWNDALYAYHNGTASWTVEYMGTGLNSAQSESIVSSQQVKDSVDGIWPFGGVMHEGLLGYVLPRNDCLNIANQVVFFATDLEIESGVPQIQSYTLDNDHPILEIKVASAGRVLTSTINRLTSEPNILVFQSLSELRSCLTSKAPLLSIGSSLGSLVPTQWCTNATTCTALDQHGKVYTSTFDSRYSKCLGRSYEGTPAFDVLPYLSEINISVIASGAYLSAAVSTDGEMFLWGQSTAGREEELNVLKEIPINYQTEPGQTGIWVEGQDDFVKCLMVHIDGEEARVYSLAVGHGHIIVAAEVAGSGGTRQLAAFSAGENAKYQTGLESGKAYVPGFTELKALKGEHIQQLVAAGWYSLLVRNDNPKIEHTHYSASGVLSEGSI